MDSEGNDKNKQLKRVSSIAAGLYLRKRMRSSGSRRRTE